MNKTKFVRQARLPRAVYEELRGEQAMAFFASGQGKLKTPLTETEPQGDDYVQCEGEGPYGRCINHVTPRQEAYSRQHFNKVLCWSHQKQQ